MLYPPPVREPIKGFIPQAWARFFEAIYTVLARINPSVSADNGDKDVTVTAGKNASTQRFATPLTQNRTVTLSTSSVWKGARFRIVREASAGGSYTLDVGPGLKSLNAGQWVDVEYDGSSWRVTAAGNL